MVTARVTAARAVFEMWEFSMTADCDEKAHVARNNETVLLRAVAGVGYPAVESRLGWDKTKCSRFFHPGDGEPARATIREVLQFCELAGVALVDASGGTETVPLDEIKALRTLAKKALG